MWPVSMAEPSGLSLLKELGEILVDIHGQSEHLSLLNVRAHLGLLDRYAGVESSLAAYRKAYQNLLGLRRELNESARSPTGCRTPHRNADLPGR